MSCNRWRGEVMLPIGNLTLLLRPTFDALARIEQALDTSLPQLVRNIERRGLHARELFAVLTQAGDAQEAQLLRLLVKQLRSLDVLNALSNFFRMALGGGGGQQSRSNPAPQSIPPAPIEQIHPEFPWREMLTLSLGALCMTPDTFWSMTLLEFRLLLDGLQHRWNLTLPPSRAELEQLMQRLPDHSAKA